MKLLIHPAYASHKKDIVGILNDFDHSGTPLGKGERNQIKLFDYRGQTLNVKSFKIPNPINKIVYKYFRKSKAQRSFENAMYLLEHGMGTPQPIAYAENFYLFGLKDSYYASAHIDYDLTFRELITNPKYPEREIIIKHFTKFTFLLHENNILFKDHSPGNTLIKKVNGQYRFYLVDLNRMEFKKLSYNERIKNFARLTPKMDMVKAISEAYASLIKKDKDDVFRLMWQMTEDFQEKYHRKRKLKKKYIFWRKK
tara:strand:- start:229576 stop:230337 length:762 start_codon:yes stop_codon:yes gene_type:complete